MYLTNNLKNVLLLILFGACLWLLSCNYLSFFLLPNKIIGYESGNLTEKSKSFLVIAKKGMGFLWESNGNKELTHYIISSYDPITKKLEKTSLFMSVDGAGMIFIRHEGRSQHWEGGKDDVVSWPNIREYKIDEAGDMKLQNGSLRPFP